MQFVTDFLWSSPLGLYINAQDTRRNRPDHRLGEGPRRPARSRATASTTCASPPTCGRRTSSTTSTCTVVDHPADTEMYVDERFFLTPTGAAGVCDQTAAAGRACRGRPGRRRDRLGPPHRRPLPRHLRPRQVSRASLATTTLRWTSATTPRRRVRFICWRPAGSTRTDSSINVAIEQGKQRSSRTASSSKCPTARAAGRSAGRRSASRPARTRRL